MSGRRERVLTGRTNTGRYDEIRPLTSARSSFHSPIKPEANFDSSFDSSTNVFRNSGSMQMMNSIKAKKLAEREADDHAELQTLGTYNSHSRPIISSIAPLRSVLLDPEVNNIPPSKMKSELSTKLKLACSPHRSFDVDGDGWVSQEDNKIAKRFDLSGDGVLDPDEQRLAKQLLVDEFIKDNESGLRAIRLLGGRSKKLVDTLIANTAREEMNLPETIKVLNEAKFALKQSTRELMGAHDFDEAGTKTQRFYTNKLDCTAYNDYDKVPRHTSVFGLDSHGGSRRRMFFARHETAAEISKEGLERVYSAAPKLSAKRFCTITNPAVENS